MLTELVKYNLGSEINPEDVIFWDGNDDGYEDILLYQGHDGGSGGSWDYYAFFVWSEEEQRYKEEYFPSNTGIDFETHKVYSRGQVGAPHQYYEIYGLQDGKYVLAKQLELIYEVDVDKNQYVDTAYYSDWTGREEETDITDLDWTETKELLEEKYPEFNFWREG